MKGYTFLEQLTPALDAKDTDAVLALLAEDCLFQAGNNAPLVGRMAIKDTLDYFFTAVKGIQHTITDAFESGDNAVYRGHVTYTRHDDSVLTIPVCDVFKIKNQKITEYTIYIDWSDLFKN
jgi:ketosteroid isomerase-like protein